MWVDKVIDRLRTRNADSIVWDLGVKSAKNEQNI